MMLLIRSVLFVLAIGTLMSVRPLGFWQGFLVGVVMLDLTRVAIEHLLYSTWEEDK